MSWQNFVVSLLLRARMKPLSRRGIEVAKMRALTAKPSIPPRIPKGWRIRETSEPPVGGEWIVPEAGSDLKTRRTFVYFHGGGYCFCTPKTHRPITLALAAGAEARTFVPAYRLAPEHRFPAAIEDAVAVYRGLLADGTPANRIILGGDSAGGGLALATLLSLREAGDPLPAGAVLFSPWIDLAATGASIVTNDKRDVMFTGDSIAKGARHYLGDTPPTNPLASPLYADLKGLPPLFIQASDSEVLLDDSVRLAEKASKAGVPVSFKVWSGLPHVWQLFAPILPEGRAALAETAAFMQRVVA